MATVLKVGMEMKIQKDVTVTASFEHIVEDDGEAKELGAQDAKLLTAWIQGYGSVV